MSRFNSLILMTLLSSLSMAKKVCVPVSGDSSSSINIAVPSSAVISTLDEDTFTVKPSTSSIVSASSSIVSSSSSSASSAATTLQVQTTSSPTSSFPSTTTSGGSSSANLYTNTNTPSLDTTTHTGRGTYWTPSSGNACHFYDANESQLVVAIGIGLYESGDLTDEYISDYCGQHINVKYNGTEIKVKVIDACGSCGDNDLDFSPTAFGELAELEKGIIQVDWEWAQ